MVLVVRIRVRTCVGSSRLNGTTSHAAIAALAKEGKTTGKDVARAIKQYKIDIEKSNPVGVRIQ